MSRFPREFDAFGDRRFDRGGSYDGSTANERQSVPPYPRFSRWLDRQLERFDARFSHYRIANRATSARFKRGAIVDSLKLDAWGLEFEDRERSDAEELDRETGDHESGDWDASGWDAGGWEIGGGS